MPSQDEHLPDQIEAFVHQAGLEAQRRLFQVLIEKADHELVLQQRHGKAGAGIQRRGTRPFTFKTTFGEVTVQRSRISHNHGRHDRGALSDRLEHISPTRHHPESPGCGL